ncbi:DUF1848 family protein [Ktedonosporobacter rubrisoli]|uniref:DUF1848 family protein n=1 Tax=Ktedonosporobacter rubrisoli TaxID=2509675 RepID=A0A4P6JTD9_KTERU|nr:DUF1848 domain-containing protein [Ktedonosporobacter rubrisoli]QBD78573.1 DUF1848 family protein [Ktedonosporobacter rubrisoli]
MLISASYKTDIPAFYGKWFMNRLRAGFCKMVNPYGGQVYTIDLTPEQVEGFVFWTKNIGPFLKYLPEVERRRYPFMVQHTINGYPVELESRVIRASSTVEHMKRLAAEYGPERLVWRYDPIIITSLTPLAWHRENFAYLAAALEGTTDEVVISFAQIYRKTRRNMDLAAQEAGFNWDEHRPNDELFLQQGRELVAELSQIAAGHGMSLMVCAQPTFVLPGVSAEARCIDAERLERIAGKPLAEKLRQKGGRKECGCFASKDIGAYDTCPHGCVYCYAVQKREVALQRYAAHDPQGEFLFPPASPQAAESQRVSALPLLTSDGRARKPHIP